MLSKRLMKEGRRIFYIKRFAAAVLLLVVLLLSSCASPAGEEDPSSVEARALAVVKSYRDLLDENCRGDMGEILDRLEKEGYAAMDVGGEQDFVNADIIREFLQAEHENGDWVDFYRLCRDYGLICTRFYRMDDTWRCTTARVVWENHEPCITYTQDYELTKLLISDKDYLIFTCDIPDNPGPTSHDGYVEPTTMIRLSPRDKACDSYNEKYILPLGYNHHTLFTSTWDAGDMSALCLNDLYLSLYRLEYGEYISYYNNPYPTVENSTLSMVPQAEFEALVMKYLTIEPANIREHSVYDEQSKSYPINIEAVHDGLIKLPVPEVVDYRLNNDGSITLTVDALFVEYATDRAFTHIVTVRPEADGGFEYVSNELLENEGNILLEYKSMKSENLEH